MTFVHVLFIVYFSIWYPTMCSAVKVRFVLEIILSSTLIFVTWSQWQKLALENTSNSFHHVEMASIPLPSITFCIKWYRSHDVQSYLPDSQNWTFGDYMRLSKRFKSMIMEAELSDQTRESIIPWVYSFTIQIRLISTCD